MYDKKNSNIGQTKTTEKHADGQENKQTDKPDTDNEIDTEIPKKDI